MVEVVPWGRATRRIGVLAISVDSLIEIFESRRVKDVTARKTFWKRSVNFSSLEDIKENKSQVAGNTEFYIDGVKLEFVSGFAKLSVWMNDKNVRSELVSALHSELVARRSSMDKIFGFVSWLYIPSIVILLADSYFKGEISGVLKLSSGQDVVATFPLLAIVLLQSYRTLFRKGVTYTPVPSFWALHGSGIVAGLIGTAVAGWAVTIVSFLWSKSGP